jgi:Family of unknown function (DUF5681)
MSANRKGYEVGYGKPPKQTRFKPGISGNAKGRPRGSLNLSLVLDRTLREPVVINENGRRKTITKMDAAVKQLVNKAASGELDATKQLLALVRAAEEQGQDSISTTKNLAESDQKVLRSIAKRLNRSSQGETK